MLAAQKMVCGNRALAEELAEKVALRALNAGELLIEQDADDNSTLQGEREAAPEWVNPP